MAAPAVGSDFTLVRTWKDAKQFANKFVAYRTDSDNLLGTYKINNTFFAYIGPSSQTCYIPGKFDRHTGQRSYKMNRLVIPEKNSGAEFLCEHTLQQGSTTTMRLATMDEISAIRTAINGGRAVFAEENAGTPLPQLLELSLPR